MKTRLLFATCLCCVAAHATEIYLDSSAETTTNDSGYATVNLAGTLHADPTWAAALPGSQWISYGPTGDPSDSGYFSPASGTLVTFTTTFIVSGTVTIATLQVMADNSTSVILNGHILQAANSTPGSTCSHESIGCQTSTEGVFTLDSLSPYLVNGVNTLSFGVLDVNGSPFGLDYAGHFVGHQPTPEPAPLALIGGGLVALTALRRRS